MWIGVAPFTSPFATSIRKLVEETRIFLSISSKGCPYWSTKNVGIPGITYSYATEVKPRSLKTGVQSGSVMDFEITHTTNIATAPTVDIELDRAIVVGDMNGTPANALWGYLDLLYEPRYIPFIKGPSTLLVYRGGTVATTGFTQIYWIEIKTSLLA